MNNDTESALDALLKTLRATDEYQRYAETKALAMANASVKGVYEQYRRLQMLAQADAVAGGMPGRSDFAARKEREETLSNLRRTGEFLQFDEDASAFLIAEYRYESLLGEIYKRLAQDTGTPLSELEG